MELSSKNLEHLYFFILCPNNSGSTLLVQLLGTSRNVSILPSEGQWVVWREDPRAMPFPQGNERRNWTVNEEKFADPSRYDWLRIKNIWRRWWDLEKPILVEKSPPMVVTAPLLQAEFVPSRFLISVRNPYAVCEGIRRKGGYSLTAAASHWARASQLQQRNRDHLPASLFLRYEDVCDHPEKAIRLLNEFLPELGGLDSQRVFRVMDQTGRIHNLNAQQITSLSERDIEEINTVLSPHHELLESLGYNLLTTSSLSRG
jgi:hypothetical protein